MDYKMMDLEKRSNAGNIMKNIQETYKIQQTQNQNHKKQKV